MYINDQLSLSKSKLANNADFFSANDATSKVINLDKICGVFLQLEPLTLPFIDAQGRSIQILKAGSHHLLGTVLNAQEEMTLVLGEKICNPLNPRETEKDLICRLQNLPLRKWDLIFDTQKLTLSIWPHLKAAGKYNKMGLDQAYEDMNRRLINLEKGALNKYHYIAYRIEDQKKILTKEDGTPVVKKNGALFDHIQEVKDQQRGSIRLITDIKEILGRDNLTPQERQKIEFFLAKTSKLLDDSKKFTKEPYINPATKQFHENLQKTGLTKSYNSSHQDHPAPTKGGSSGEIGGVGCHLELIEGLFDSPDSLFETQHSFFIPEFEGECVPFSHQEMCQIVQELAFGIYVHNTVPFFSLHFNQESNLYPVIHPAYENTLVGQVFAMLDYYMKGYLNGGVFDEAFVQRWQHNPTKIEMSDSLLKIMINFKNYAKSTLSGEDQRYVSVRSLLVNVHLPPKSVGEK